MDKSKINNKEKYHTILIVDDEDSELYMAESTFEILYETDDLEVYIITASNSEEALKVIKDSDIKIDLILLDINLPNSTANGIDLLTIVRRVNGESPPPIVGMLTTSTQHSDLNKSIENSTDFYLEKTEDINDYEKSLSLLVKRYIYKEEVSEEVMNAYFTYWR